jgi:hypothetical protein
MQPLPPPAWRRHKFLVLSAALAAVVAGATVTALLATRDGPETESCRLPQVPSENGTPAAAASAPGGGGLRIVEQGFTSMADLVGVPSVATGALVENTSTMVAYRTRITFTMFGPGGAVVPNKATVPTNRQVIPVIRPGERIGVASLALTVEREVPPPNRPVAVASVRIALESTQWVLPTSGGGAFAPVTTRGHSGERMLHDSVGPLQQLVNVDYIITSAYCRSIAGARGAMLYRDSAGTLIGGIDVVPESDLTTCQPGQRASWAVAQGVPETVDPAKTVVYPYCDPGRPKDPPVGVP